MRCMCLGPVTRPPAVLATCAAVRGRGITLKVKRRQAGAPEPLKFMGHGPCDNISRTITTASFTGEPWARKDLLVARGARGSNQQLAASSLPCPCA